MKGIFTNLPLNCHKIQNLSKEVLDTNEKSPHVKIVFYQEIVKIVKIDKMDRIGYQGFLINIYKGEIIYLCSYMDSIIYRMDIETSGHKFIYKYQGIHFQFSSLSVHTL